MKRSALIVGLTTAALGFSVQEVSAQPPYGEVPRVTLYCHSIMNGPVGTYNTQVRVEVADVRSQYAQQYVRVRSNFYRQTAFTLPYRLHTTNYWEGLATNLFRGIVWTELAWTGDRWVYTDNYRTPYPGLKAEFGSRTGDMFTADVELYWYVGAGTWRSMRVKPQGACKI